MASEIAPLAGQTMEAASLAEVGYQELQRAVAMQADALTFAEFYTKTGICPDTFRGKPVDAAAAIMRGAQLGLQPNQALEGFFVVHGRVGMYARTMQAIAQRCGVQFQTIEATDQVVTMEGRRGDIVERVSWTIERATKAGYTTNKLYKTNPIEMLRQKCLAELSRLLAPDALMGMYNEVEMEQVTQQQPVYTVESQRVDKPSLDEIAAEAAPPQVSEDAQAMVQRMLNAKSMQALLEAGQEAREQFPKGSADLALIRDTYNQVKTEKGW